jgi:xylulokinase
MILSIDCGSTNHKAALFDRTLVRRADCSVPVTYLVRDEERVEFDAEQLWRDTLSLILECCLRAGISPESIQTIALTSQAQTFTVVDKSGHAVMPFLSWADKRARSEAAELTRVLGEGFHRQTSFPDPAAQLQVSKLAWLRRHHPEWLTLAHAVVSLPSFLAWRLAGLNGTDTNLAAMSGLYSCVNNEWWAPALAACGVQPGQMSEVVPVGHAVEARRPCDEIKFAPKLKVVFAGNDQTAGAYANSCQSGGRILTLGTALVAYCYAGESSGPFCTTGCWGPYPGGGYYELATFDEGAAALDWSVEKLMPGAEREFMSMTRSSLPGACFFYPQRMYTDAAWSGCANLASRARATLEGICFRARQLLESGLKASAGDRPLTVIGGGSQSDFWLEILANVLNCAVGRGQGDILLGAAMMACPDVAPPSKKQEKLVLPEAAMAQCYENLYRSWLTRV